MRRGNLLDAIPNGIAEELCQTLLSRDEIRLERIVSTGQMSPLNFWYDQEEDEFVVLIAGAATLRIEENDTVVHLRIGTWVELPAHCRHRLEWTQADPPTVWLAVFLPDRGKRREFAKCK